MQVLDTVQGWRGQASDQLYEWRERSSVATKVCAALFLALLMATCGVMGAAYAGRMTRRYGEGERG